MNQFFDGALGIEWEICRDKVDWWSSRTAFVKFSSQVVLIDGFLA